MFSWYHTFTQVSNIFLTYFFGNIYPQANRDTFLTKN